MQPVQGGNVDGFLARLEDRAAGLRRLALPADRLAGRDSLLGAVTLDGVAPSGGITVSLSSSSNVVSVPGRPLAAQ